MIKVTVLGAGNVASHLAKALADANQVELVQNFNRKGIQLLPQLPTTSQYSELLEADVFLVAVGDNAITEVAQQLKQVKGVVAHTSGAISINVLQAVERPGVFYPLQTFTKGMPVALDTVPICLEANAAQDLEILQKLGKTLSSSVHHINSLQRRQLHLAAVFCSNFTNHLMYLTQQICEDKGVAYELLLPLIKETMHKLEVMGPFTAQTGPARRNDTDTMQAHLQQLNGRDLQEIYKAMSHSILHTYGNEL